VDRQLLFAPSCTALDVDDPLTAVDLDDTVGFQAVELRVRLRGCEPMRAAIS
jgi:hypothetical protein